MQEHSSHGPVSLIAELEELCIGVMLAKPASIRGAQGSDISSHWLIQLSDAFTQGPGMDHRVHSVHGGKLSEEPKRVISG